MKVLVVGASGFIGKNLALRLPKEWDSVGTFNRNLDFPNFITEHHLRMRPVQLDLRDKSNVARILENLGSFDACIYLAADNDAGQLLEHPRRDVENNVIALLNFLDSFRGGKLVYLSSGSVYTGLSGSVSPHARVDPTLSFTIGRYSSERYVKYYSRIKRTLRDFAIIRFFGAYGRFESARKITPKLIQALANEKNGPFTIFGDGKNYIDLMNVSDAADAIVKITASPLTNLETDLCFGEHRTINGYVETVARILGRKISLRHEGTSPEYIRFYASNGPLMKLFGYTPRVGLAEGIKEYAHQLCPQKF